MRGERQKAATLSSPGRRQSSFLLLRENGRGIRAPKVAGSVGLRRGGGGIKRDTKRPSCPVFTFPKGDLISSKEREEKAEKRSAHYRRSFLRAAGGTVVACRSNPSYKMPMVMRSLHGGGKEGGVRPICAGARCGSGRHTQRTEIAMYMRSSAELESCIAERYTGERGRKKRHETASSFAPEKESAATLTFRAGTQAGIVESRKTAKESAKRGGKKAPGGTGGGGRGREMGVSQPPLQAGDLWGGKRRAGSPQSALSGEKVGGRGCFENVAWVVEPADRSAPHLKNKQAWSRASEEASRRA